MSHQSPVLEALKGFKVSCRCGCGRTGSPLALRWLSWGQHGYVTEECWRKAKGESVPSRDQVNKLKKDFMEKQHQLLKIRKVKPSQDETQ